MVDVLGRVERRAVAGDEMVVELADVAEVPQHRLVALEVVLEFVTDGFDPPEYVVLVGLGHHAVDDRAGRVDVVVQPDVGAEPIAFRVDNLLQLGCGRTESPSCRQRRTGGARGPRVPSAGREPGESA